MFVKANAGAEDKYYIAGHVFRIISCLNQVLFACDNAYLQIPAHPTTHSAKN